MAQIPPLSYQQKHVDKDGKPTSKFFNWLQQATSSFITADDTVSFTNKTFADSTDVLGIVKMTLGSDATGDTWYRNSSGLLTRLPIGSNGNVLTVAAGLPSWAAPAKGFAFLGNVAVSAGALADTTIVAANNAAYSSFLFVLKNILVTTVSAIASMQVHSGGAFQATAYVSTYFGSSNGGGISPQTGSTGFNIGGGFAGITSGIGISGYAVVSNLGGTSAPKMWRGDYAFQNASAPSVAVGAWGGYWNGNGAIDGFQIVDSTSSTDLASGSVDIYGMQ